MSNRKRERSVHFGQQESPLALRRSGGRRRRSLLPPAFPRINRKGYVTVMVALGLVALLGTAAMSVDIGRVMMAAQRAQDVADAAAFAAGSMLRVPADAITAAQQVVAANNLTNQGFPIVCNYVVGS